MYDLLLSPGIWNYRLIEQRFLPVDWSEIFAILVGFSSSSDRLIWHYGKNEMYSVKSGYMIALNDFIGESCPSDSSTHR